jgi:integrase/recombinase XerD
LQTLCRVWRWLLAKGVRGVGTLRRQDLQGYIDARLGAGRAASTVNRELRDLWAFLRFVEDQGQPVSPGVFRIPRLKEKKPLPRYLAEEEYRRLETHLLAKTQDDTDDACLDRSWFYLLAHGGLRLGELCDLRLGDLDLAGRRLAIREGKGRRDRVVPLSATTCQMLCTYLLVRGPAHTDHLLTFRQEKMNPDLVRIRLQRYGTAVGVHVSPHRLRHTLATRLVNAGMDIVSIQRLLGHEKLETTMIYARVHDTTMEQDFRQAMTRLESGRRPDSMLSQTELDSLAEELFSHAHTSLPAASR